MNIIKTPIEGLLVVEPKVFPDDRGYFLESYQKKRYLESGIEADFVQDNLSKSVKGTLRGLHYQLPPFDQAKLVQVIAGEVFDVAVDIRKGSPTFGHHFGLDLSAENKRQFFIPRGFAHGFCVTSETAIFYYKCDSYYSPSHERGIHWSDGRLDINWPAKKPVISDKDASFACLNDVGEDDLPGYYER